MSEVVGWLLNFVMLVLVIAVGGGLVLFLLQFLRAVLQARADRRRA